MEERFGMQAQVAGRDAAGLGDAVQIAEDGTAAEAMAEGAQGAQAAAEAEAAQAAAEAEVGLEAIAESAQVEVLLFARRYLSTLFHKLLGGVPTAELLEVLTAPETLDVVDEYAVGSAVMAGLKSFLASLGDVRERDAEKLLDEAQTEYTRIFIGPGALPASPYESPYTGAHDMGVFQENTLAVRGIYRAQGYQAQRIQAVPDDHIALMCHFLAKLGVQSQASFYEGGYAQLADALYVQRDFEVAHMAHWLGTYTASVRNSDAAAAHVLYPQLLEALAAFIDCDIQFCAEAAYWAVQNQDQAGQGACEPRAELADAARVLAALEDIEPLGIADNRLVPVTL